MEKKPNEKINTTPNKKLTLNDVYNSMILQHDTDEMPYRADEKYIRQYTIWDAFASDLKGKSILNDCSCVSWEKGEYAEIPYLGSLTTHEIVSNANAVNDIDPVAKMINIPRRYFSAKIVLPYLTLQCNGEKIIPFYKHEIAKQLCADIENIVFDEIHNKISDTVVYSSRDAIQYEDIIHATKTLQTFDTNLQIVMDANTYDALRTTKNSCGTHYIIENDMLDKYHVTASANLTNEIIIGDFSKIAVVSFTKDFVSLVIDKYSNATTADVAIIARCNANAGIIDTSAFKRFIISSGSSSSSSSASSL